MERGEPDRQINLTYIPHAEMVPKLAQAIASGDVPDLMGLDLIYGPQFASAGQLEDITDLIGSDPTLETISEGHMAVATWDDRLYGVPLYADVSVLFWNKGLFEQAGLDPEKPPTNLTELHDMAAKITALGGGNYGYYLPGNCAGCNIFTFAPMIWASGGTIEAGECGDEALVGDTIPDVLEWARMMHKEGHIDPAAQAENGETFAEVFGSGKVGIMGTGNFNVVLAKEQNPTSTSASRCCPASRRARPRRSPAATSSTVPKGSKRIDDAVDFMKFILSDEIQVELYAKSRNMTTRADMADNEFFDRTRTWPDTAQAIPVAQTPYTLKFFELINSPQGPWLQMLQRSTTRTTRSIRSSPTPRRRWSASPASRRRPRPCADRPRRFDERRGRSIRRIVGDAGDRDVRDAAQQADRAALYVTPALLFVLAFTVYPFVRMFWISLNDWSLITPPEYVGLDNFSRMPRRRAVLGVAARSRSSTRS